MIVHLNGALLPRDEAVISPFDRGFLFGDGVYEGLRAFDGRVVGLPHHIERMRGVLAETRLRDFDAESIATLTMELLDANDLRNAFIYWQVTRGAPSPSTTGMSLRKRIPGEEIDRPTVFGYCVPLPGLGECREPKRVAARTVEDRRWSCGHIKCVSLMANVMAAMEAHEGGADDAVFLRDGLLTEASSTNVVVRVGDRLVTPPVERGHNLRGVTRLLLLEERPEIEVAEVPESQLRRADEIMLLGTATMVASVVSLDGERVGEGEPGHAARSLLRSLVERIARDTGVATPAPARTL